MIKNDLTLTKELIERDLIFLTEIKNYFDDGINLDNIKNNQIIDVRVAKALSTKVTYYKNNAHCIYENDNIIVTFLPNAKTSLTFSFQLKRDYVSTNDDKNAMSHVEYMSKRGRSYTYRCSRFNFDLFNSWIDATISDIEMDIEELSQMYNNYECYLLDRADLLKEINNLISDFNKKYSFNYRYHHKSAYNIGTDHFDTIN